jgi:DNA-binding protein HU-beta
MKKILGKEAIVHLVAARADVSPSDTTKVIDVLTDVIREELSKGHEVRLIGFGTWSLREIAQRRVKDIRSGNWKILPATKRVGFKVGSILSQAALIALRREYRRK